MINAAEAIERLKLGNRQFMDNIQNEATLSKYPRPAELVREQEPFAIILGCSDARVPAEIVFNQGLGDLFVIRVAGNIVAPTQIGSIEFAAAKFGTPLVVVLGHTQCGAVTTTLDELQQPTENQSPNLRTIVDRVRPSVEQLLETDLASDRHALIRAGVRANVAKSVQRLRNGSDILEQLITDKQLTIIGAEYAIETGEVVFLDEYVED
ncbi:carbonic anhydrase [Salinisphaera dokdonensis CL-ES53]|uniref:Carbonic anhydrase n=1 Tax=Salinisphaera dokdonensis CL-ES53 TaxID=1304272 RepID=A0ABV2B2N2_9GAMM